MMTTRNKINILYEYFDRICEDIDFEEIFQRTGIKIFPRTKHQLCNTIIELEEK